MRESSKPETAAGGTRKKKGSGETRGAARCAVQACAVLLAGLAATCGGGAEQQRSPDDLLRVLPPGNVVVGMIDYEALEGTAIGALTAAWVYETWLRPVGRIDQVRRAVWGTDTDGSVDIVIETTDGADRSWPVGATATEIGEREFAVRTDGMFEGNIGSGQVAISDEEGVREMVARHDDETAETPVDVRRLMGAVTLYAPGWVVVRVPGGGNNPIRGMAAWIEPGGDRTWEVTGAAMASDSSAGDRIERSMEQWVEQLTATGLPVQARVSRWSGTQVRMTGSMNPEEIARWTAGSVAGAAP